MIHHINLKANALQDQSPGAGAYLAISTVLIGTATLATLHWPQPLGFGPLSINLVGFIVGLLNSARRHSHYRKAMENTVRVEMALEQALTPWVAQTSAFVAVPYN